MQDYRRLQIKLDTKPITKRQTNCTLTKPKTNGQPPRPKTKMLTKMLTNLQTKLKIKPQPNYRPIDKTNLQKNSRPYYKKTMNQTPY